MYLSHLVLLIISPMLLMLLLCLAVSAMISTTPASPFTGTEASPGTRVTLLCDTSSNAEQLTQMECVILLR